MTIKYSRRNLQAIKSQYLDHIEIKKYPGDFCVTEAIPLGKESRRMDGGFIYYKLRKCGFSTFEAIDFMASYFDVAPEKISYCGLKDEDGITDQFVAIPYRDSSNDREQSHHFSISKNRWLSVLRYGRFEEPLKIGGLSGNCFRIKARGVPNFIASELNKVSHIRRLSFINYYDRQRFGVPDGKKTTHLIGEALLRGQEDEAFALLKDAGTPESKRAAKFEGNSAEFFRSLDPRVCAFFMSSASSFNWNVEVNKLLNRYLSIDEFCEEIIDRIPLGFAVSQNALRKLLLTKQTYPYKRYGKGGDPFNYALIERPISYDIDVMIGDVKRDESTKESMCVELIFFLPPGTYATNVVRQFFLTLS